MSGSVVCQGLRVSRTGISAGFPEFVLLVYRVCSSWHVVRTPFPPAKLEGLGEKLLKH